MHLRIPDPGVGVAPGYAEDPTGNDDAVGAIIVSGLDDTTVTQALEEWNGASVPPSDRPAPRDPR